MEDWSLLRADGYPQGDPRGRYEFRPDRKRPVSCQHRGSPWTCAESLLRGVCRGEEKRGLRLQKCAGLSSGWIVQVTWSRQQKVLEARESTGERGDIR